ncbi:transcriptional regulator [Ralstonia solanacearum]|nr:hypothetical protein LBM341_03195 [Ralstonia solanacearum]UYR02278.1 hypothetical protein NQS37_02235 [Ralstonia pseudosolanacearum]NJZ70605.1 transcriptional regulator [Ralstonia solanacearum]NJZ80271.1 transcriptional regulator [Ralstonia solanacearum]NJZ84009.1 transcriptional regulator [Ralstonia solanacearum]
MTETRFKSDASEAVHSAASGLHRAGLTGKNGMDASAAPIMVRHHLSRESGNGTDHHWR